MTNSIHIAELTKLALEEVSVEKGLIGLSHPELSAKLEIQHNLAPDAAQYFADVITDAQQIVGAGVIGSDDPVTMARTMLETIAFLDR